MSDYTPPLTSIQYLLRHITPVGALSRLPAYSHVDLSLAEAVIGEAARFTQQVLGPLNEIGDHVGSRLEGGRVVTPPGFREAYKAYVDGGWVGIDLPLEVGGQALPRVVQTAIAEMVNGACVSFGMLPLMERAATKVLIAHAEPGLKGLCVPKLISGEWGATIAMSEAGAGSDVGRARTRAERQADGSYRLSGTKIFITYGDQDFTDQIVHLVLARVVGAPAGVKGLSLFAVPSRLWDAAGGLGAANRVGVSRVEKKMGLKASPTCVVDFDGATGFIIGAEGEGLNNIFTMVNTMRIEVAIQGVGVAAAATAKATRYALERPQGGAPDRDPVMIIDHADVRRMLMTMHSRTEAMRALIFEAAFQLDLADAADTVEQRDDARALAEWLLPVCKACGSETGFAVANLAVQVFGGRGYVMDAGVEQYVRDSRVMSIYEGANGIQALDLVTRRLPRHQGRGLRLFAQRIRGDIETAGTSAIRDAVARELARLEELSTWMVERLAADPRDAMAGAMAYLDLVGLVAGGWMWMRMIAVADAERNRRTSFASFYAENLMAAGAMLAAQARAGAANIDALSVADWELAGHG